MCTVISVTIPMENQTTTNKNTANQKNDEIYFTDLILMEVTNENQGKSNA